MDYELDEKLKEAGFPFRYAQHPSEIVAPGIEFHDGSIAYIPTLSELIEACGERFNSLGHGFKDWFADGLIELEDTNSGVIGRGDNPIIAVTKLYIALNEKDG